MSVEIKVPVLPESVADATIVTWHKKPGEFVSRDESIVDIETDKVVLEVVAPNDGKIEKIVRDEGDTVIADEVIALFNAGSASDAAPETIAEPANEAAPAPAQQNDEIPLGPGVRRMLAEHGLEASAIPIQGPGRRLTRQDVLKYLEGEGGNQQTATKQAPAQKQAPAKKAAPAPKKEAPKPAPVVSVGEREEKRVPMTRLRSRIAERLVEAQQTAAILTTFNEINMKPIMDLRKRYKDQFEKEHGVRLGFMSFFVKATVEALKKYPEVNASIDGNDVVYHGYYDVGIAVSAPRGLVVPVLRNAEDMSLADIEKAIRNYGEKATNNQLTVDELTGGTFTISNGGVFGSLMATPILNPPQSGILGMHRIQDRPMAVDGKVEILPMMYVAFSYDHRIIDGRESVGFLKTIKELLEDPARILLNI